MSFKDLNLKKTYSSDIDEILLDFYIPILKESVDYQRLSGFFSSSSLAVAASGIGDLVKNNGSMKLIISPKLSERDFQAIKTSTLEPEKVFEKIMLSDIEQLKNEFERDHVYALGWMLANKKLEIRVAIPYDKEGRALDSQKVEESGIFHQKVAIFTDAENNIVTFSGSVNESAAGWTGHIEEFKVFRSWDPSEKGYLESDLSKFSRFWENRSPKVDIINLPDAVKNKLIEIAPKNFENIDLEKWYERKKRKMTLYTYQKSAVESWIDGDMQGIFNMATGTGKTFTAFGCLDYALNLKTPLFAVIASPYSHLVQQWNKEIDRFGIKYDKLIIADSKTKWKDELADGLRNLELNQLSSIVVLTTHATLSSKDFIEIFQNAEKTRFESFLIVDEVHGIGSEKRKLGLSPDYKLRLGLSATPNRFFDDIGTEAIINYFGPVLFEFSLEDAIINTNPATGETYLTPYRYFPLFLSLNRDEREEYIRKTKNIAIQVSRAHSSKERQEKLQNLLINRARIIKNADEKINYLRQLLIKLGSSIKWTIIYCEDKHQMDKVIEIATELRLISHRFTMEEGTVPQEKYHGLSQRGFLLENFANGKYQLLVAKKCLDEGVDVPAARVAIIMASSTNPREYIQRIGRVIRRSKGKREASIYDMIVAPSLAHLPPEIRKIERDIFQKEIKRSQYIAELALNNVEALKLIHQKIQES